MTLPVVVAYKGGYYYCMAMVSNIIFLSKMYSSVLFHTHILHCKSLPPKRICVITFDDNTPKHSTNYWNSKTRQSLILKRPARCGVIHTWVGKGIDKRSWKESHFLNTRALLFISCLCKKTERSGWCIPHVPRLYTVHVCSPLHVTKYKAQ